MTPLPVRRFTRASSEYIHFALGNQVPFNGTTVAAIVKKTSDPADYEQICMASDNADPDNWQFYVAPDKKLGLWCGVAELKSTFTVTNADGWVMVAASKESGLHNPRMHKCVLATEQTAPGTGWTHQDASLPGENSGPVFTKNTVGSSNTHTGGFLDALVLAVAVWHRVIDDTTLESMSTVRYADMTEFMAAWVGSTPSVVWRFDQTTVSAVNDQTGGGANQNAIGGTSVVENDSPPFAPSTDVFYPQRVGIGTLGGGITR